VFERLGSGKRPTRIDERFRRNKGQDAPAQIFIQQQQEPLRRFEGFFLEVAGQLLLVEVAGTFLLVEESVKCELPEPGIRVESRRIESLSGYPQQVRGANGVEARRERLLHPGAQRQEPRQLQRSQLLAPEAQAGGIPRLFGDEPPGVG
jgi:hypothetical protein